MNQENNFFTYEQFEHNNEEQLDFLKMIYEFKNLDYNEKIEYIKNKFGKIEEKTIPFGINCKLVIYFGDDEKYHFDFESDNISLEFMQEVFPELTKLMENNSAEEIKKLYPEFQYELFDNRPDVKQPKL